MICVPLNFLHLALYFWFTLGIVIKSQCIFLRRKQQIHFAQQARNTLKLNERRLHPCISTAQCWTYHPSVHSGGYGTQKQWDTQHFAQGQCSDSSQSDEFLTAGANQEAAVLQGSDSSTTKQNIWYFVDRHNNYRTTGNKVNWICFLISYTGHGNFQTATKFHTAQLHVCLRLYAWWGYSNRTEKMAWIVL